MRLLLLCLTLPLAPAQAGDIGPALLALECSTTEVETCTATDGILTAVLVRAPHDAFFADVVPVDREGDIASLFADELCPDAPASVIGGYFGERDDGAPYPIGLVLSDGIAAAPWAPWEVGGAIVVDPGLATAIRSWRDIDPAALDAREALQSKPILVDANRNDGIADRSDGWNRVAFGLTGSGDLVLAGVFTATGTGMGRGPTLAGFADWLAAVRFPDGAVIDRAINLDGGPSATLYLRAEYRLFGSDKQRYVPDVICLAVR
jgi:hypothetical protein